MGRKKASRVPGNEHGGALWRGTHPRDGPLASCRADYLGSTVGKESGWGGNWGWERRGPTLASPAFYTPGFSSKVGRIGKTSQRGTQKCTAAQKANEVLFSGAQ
jgi:hypothetical protein